MLMYRPCRETYEESLKDVAMFESVETMFYQIYDGDEFSVREVISKSIYIERTCQNRMLENYRHGHN